MKHTYNVPDIIKDDIAEIIRRFADSPFSHNIIKIILYGSFAGKTYQPDSDIDLAVVVRQKPEKSRLADYYMLTDGIHRATDVLFCTEEELASGKYVFSEILPKGVLVYENL